MPAKESPPHHLWRDPSYVSAARLPIPSDAKEGSICCCQLQTALLPSPLRKSCCIFAVRCGAEWFPFLSIKPVQLPLRRFLSMTSTLGTMLLIIAICHGEAYAEDSSAAMCSACCGKCLLLWLVLSCCMLPTRLLESILQHACMPKRSMEADSLPVSCQLKASAA